MATATAMGSQGGIQRRVMAGVVGGVAGGAVFGMLMVMMGMLPMVAALAGSSSSLVGLMVHMLISIVIGGLFGLAAGSRVTTPGSGAVWGLANGVVWWILGAVILMPVMMGMGAQFSAMFTPPLLLSLMGHMAYGAVGGVVYAWYARRG